MRERQTMCKKKPRELIAELGVKHSPGSSVNQGWTYSPIPFSGYEDVPCHRREASYKRWDAIVASNVLSKDSSLIEFGSSTGFFVFMSAPLVRYAVGIERDKAALEVALSLASEQRVSNVDFLDHTTADNILGGFNVVLMLNVLNWMGRESAESKLRRIQPGSSVFIEMPLAGDGMGGAEWLRTNEELKAWLAEFKLSCIAKLVTSMGPGGKERDLFLFEKK